MKKICFVVQRYGLEVNGGAELHCRQLAEHLHPFYDVTVLTTKAVDYISWANAYEKDEEEINGVRVLRFGVEYPREMEIFNEVNARFARGEIRTREEQEEWLDKQGPYVPSLLNYIREEKDAYNAFIFFTYLYYPTVKGIPLVREKAILIPTAHREPFLEMSMYRDVFCLPRGIFYNTREERYLAEFVFENENIPNDIGGVGVQTPEYTDPSGFRAKYGLEQYLLYVGRIDTAKGCEWLFRFFKRYKQRRPGSLKLVLMGKPVIPIPDDENIISLGFVDEKDKFDGMAGAEALVLPSEFESLSIVVLESMAVKRPVIVNGKCEVLAGHCIRSNGGLYYESYSEFEGAVDFILEHPETADIMGENGKRYVEKNYRWEQIVERLCQLIEMKVSGQS